MAARTHSCAATSAASSLGQQSWQAFVITTDPTSPRARRSAEILNASGIDVVLTRAVEPASNAFVDKVKSHTRTSRDVFESISSMHAPADEYVLVFEDDILLTPAVQPQHVRSYLACAARLSLQHGLPLFYTGGCSPKFALNQTFWGAAYIPAAHKANELAAVRMTCRCAHAYAVRRGDAKVFYRLADEQPDRTRTGVTKIAKNGFYMDVQLDALSFERKGVFLLGANLPSPQDPRDRGLWLQDRRTFRSGIGRPRLDDSGFTEPLNARLL